MIIVDAHQDIAYNALGFDRDYRRSALETRRLEVNSETPSRNGIATVGLPDAILGRVALTFGTLFVAPSGKNPAPWDSLVYTTPQQAHDLAQKQLDYYHRLADESDRIILVQDEASLDAVLATWGPETELADHKMGLVVLMENADPILEPKQFEEWYGRGVRLVGPAWQGTRYCGGTGQPGPLTPLGRELLEVMASFNAILDLSHMAEESYLEAVDRYEGVIIASHSNSRKFRNSDRHLSDEMILRLAERDGVMGTVLYNAFLKDGWKKPDIIPLGRVIEAIDYVCQLTGSAAHVGIGSDFDGGFGAESIPEGIDTVTDLLAIAEALKARGYSAADTEAIMSGNMLRVLRRALKGN